MRASTLAGWPPARRLFTLAAALLVVAGIAEQALSRLSDPLPGAWWIGFSDAARRGSPAEIAFAAKFRLEGPAPGARLKIRAVGSGRVFVDGAPVGEGTGAGDLAVPLGGGDHEILVVLRHPEGVASLRARLETPERTVVTGPGWRVDDDSRRVERMGFGGARYPATLWTRPPVSALDSSSSASSWRGRAADSSAPSSSRIPSRAATE